MDWYLAARDPLAVADLRREIGGYLRRHAAPGSDIDGAEVIVSELLTNASRHTSDSAWVSLRWATEHPVLKVYDLGPGFDVRDELPDQLDDRGRGLVIVGQLAERLEVAARRHGGAEVTVTLPVSRPAEADLDPPRHSGHALPGLDEARPEGAFGREAFLRALVVQLAQAIEEQLGPHAAEAAVAQVGIDVGAQMEAEYRLAEQVVGRMDADRLGECFVRLKHAIDGEFYVIEATPERIVLGNRRCPFGDVVQKAPALCRMTSSVFGGIAASQHEDGAAVMLEERIAVGDPECRVVVYLGDPPGEAADLGHRYRHPRSDG